MLIVQTNNNGHMTNGFAERNHNAENEQKEIRDEIMGEGQEFSEEDESRINEDDQDVNDEATELVHVQIHGQGVMRKQQHQSQGPSVHGERFLPLRSLKVLLVENDDSTRHVVSALLRNCGYEVTAVANGVQAWKLLEHLTNHIDLVLTEVTVPFLSGIGLLSKIMSHRTCRNIPVLMMSSHDSIKTVFKCLSKGAVDFLVKPIRKNELKNLWQHVWRKCHSVGDSGSESAARTQKSTKSKSADESDNNTGSDGEDDNGRDGLNARDGSGAQGQSVWRKGAVEVDSPKPMTPWEQLVDPPDSTCTQVIHSKPEEGDNNWVLRATTTKHGEQDDEVDNVSLGKDIEIGVPRISNLQLKDQSKRVLTNMAGNNGEKFPEIESKHDGGQIEKGQLELSSGKHNAELRNQGNDKNGVTTNGTNPQIESVVLDITNGLSCKKNEAIYETKEMPSLELSFKRLIDTETSSIDRNVLRRSHLSAFSRYNSVSTANQAPIGNLGSCSSLDNSSEAAKTESMQNLQSNSISTPNQRSNGSSSKNDMGSATNNAFTKSLVISDKPAPKSTVKCLQPSSAFQPVKNDHALIPQPIQGKGDAAISNAILTQSRGLNQRVQVQHHHHHYHHYHHHVHNSSQQQHKQANHDDPYLKNMAAAAAPQCGSSNMLSTPMEGNACNYILKGSSSGSDLGSNTALNPSGINMENNNGAAGECGTPGASGVTGSRTGVGQSRFALREAALNKFRKKRKERCFERKVRCHRRKKVEEQRPGIRGQFVRQAQEH